ncbi:MAG: 16S rRNA (cytosine(1402)-N(4))-methyltransferase RsmH [Candidatus Rokubacteria bacterium]|nr:16S rRNA (cytosine(1402)-N(4))-methyltransferase RsmH [Candidatus Rokubacteria bacterium]
MKARRRPANEHVYWALSPHDRPEGPGQHPGALPECPGPVRGQPDRRARRRLPQRVPVRGVGAAGLRHQRAVALRRGGAQARPALDLAGPGGRARRRRARAAGAGQPPAGGPRQGRDAGRDRARVLRGLGPRAVRGVRADARGRAARQLRAALAAGGEVVHLPVLVDEVVFLLRPRGEGWVIDGTVGMGGHAEAILTSSGPGVRVLGLDVDPEALARAGERLRPFGDRVRLARESFRNLRAAAAAHGIERARAVLLDLGVSSYQLEAAGRGFSFQADEPLDMRLDPAGPTTAADLLNRLPEAELARILFEHGDEPHARRIARAIVRRRPLATSGDLVAAVRSGVPRAAWPRRLHVATRTFQALRMAVNDEPGALRQALAEAPPLLAAGGRLGVISFHSGEDRIVKRAFRELGSAGFAELEPSPVQPGDDEVRANPRARSAKLRVLERLR